MCQIKYHTGFKERKAYLDKNKSLRITTFLVWNSKGKCRTLKKDKNQLREGKQSQKGQKKSESQVDIGAGVEEKGWNVTKKWVTHDHKSMNHTLAVAEGICGVLT